MDRKAASLKLCKIEWILNAAASLSRDGCLQLLHVGESRPQRSSLNK